MKLSFKSFSLKHKYKVKAYDKESLEVDLKRCTFRIMLNKLAGVEHPGLFEQNNLFFTFSGSSPPVFVDHMLKEDVLNCSSVFFMHLDCETKLEGICKYFNVCQMPIVCEISHTSLWIYCRTDTIYSPSPLLKLIINRKC